MFTCPQCGAESYNPNDEREQYCYRCHQFVTEMDLGEKRMNQLPKIPGIDYPNIICEEHPGQIEPGYMICKHIEKKEDIAYLEKATQKSLGVLCCLQCSHRSGDDQYVFDNFLIVCAPGLRERGWLLNWHGH